MWRWGDWKILIQDLRHAVRLLKRSPGFTFTAILTLALGIGASTAIFTIVDSTLLKPLSYRDSGDLVALWERVVFLGADPVGPNPRHVDIWQKRAASFRGVALLRQAAIGLTKGTDHPELIGTVMASPNLFEVLQVTPLLGRGFIPDDAVEGRDRVAILTHSLWQSLFHSDPDIIGKSVRIGDVPRQVIGVLPGSFHFPNRNALRPFQSKQPLSSVPEPSVFVPLVVDLTGFSWNGEYGNWIALARLKSGIGVDQAQAELNSIVPQIVQEMPAGQRDTRPNSIQAFVQPMQEAVVGNSRTGLWLLMAAVLSLMLIACVNLASAQLARTLSRRREASVRAALGAPHWRLIWNSLTENLLLAAAGGAAGVFVASEALDLFRRYSPVDLPRLSEVQLNNTVLLFSIALTVGSTVLFSILPALSLLRINPQSFLQQGSSRALGNRIGRRLHGWLIGLQVFGGTALLLITGLLAKNLLNLIYQEKGFETGQVAFAQVNLSGQTYGPAKSRIAFIDSTLESLRAVPGVQAAGFVSAMPLEGESWVDPVGRVDQPQRQSPLVNLRWVSPGYFDAMRHRLIAGRFIEDRDRDLNSVVLSEGVARSLWGNANPIGETIRTEGKPFTVIGVVADSRITSLKTLPTKIAYLHYKERTGANLFFMVRSAQSADTLVPSIRTAIWKLAPQVTIARAKALDAQVTESLAAERFQTFVLTTFGISALFLAMLGIYGLLSYSVAVRKQEIGLRMALGATRRRIYSHTFGEAAAPVLVGLATGLIAGFAAGRTIRQVLYGAQGVDLTVMLIVAASFLAAAAGAALLPARRAASVDPMESLRSD